MDKERQVRFLCPPLFLLGSLSFGIFLDPQKSAADFLPSSSTQLGVELIATILAGGIVIVTLGFLIGTLSITILRIGFYLFGKRSYEAVLGEADRDRVRQQIGLERGAPRSKYSTLFELATYDHEYLKGPVHDWIVRRWNAFSVSAHSVVSFAVAPVAGGWLGVLVGKEWITATVGIVILFVFHAACAWRDTMGMIRVQALRQRVGNPDD